MSTAPLSNVFWISYLFYYLTSQYIKYGPGRKADNKRDIELVAMDLDSRLDFMQTRRVDEDEDGRFFDAGECLNYCVQRGWISEAQLNGDMLWEGESFLHKETSSNGSEYLKALPTTGEEQAASTVLTRERTPTTPKVVKNTKLRNPASRPNPLTPSINIKNLRPRPHSTSPRKQPSEPCSHSYSTSPSKKSSTTALGDSIKPSSIKSIAVKTSTTACKGSIAATAVEDKMPRTRSSRRQQEKHIGEHLAVEEAVHEVTAKPFQNREEKAPKGRKGRTADR
jgi:hypothetical protein